MKGRLSLQSSYFSDRLTFVKHLAEVVRATLVAAVSMLKAAELVLVRL
jgi:hypothetical protein